MVSHHQMSESAVPVSLLACLPLGWIGWYSFRCVLASVPVRALTSLASSVLSSAVSSTSPLSFYAIQMLCFHILQSIRANQNSKHPHFPPTTLLFLYVPFKTKPLQKELSAYMVSTFLPLIFSRVCKVHLQFKEE